MSHESQQPDRPVSILPPVNRRDLWLLSSAGMLGIALAGIGVWSDDQGFRRLALAYLVAFCFVLSLSLGALFFLLIQYLTRAGWSVVVRRPAEILGMNMVAVALLFLPLGWVVWQRGDLLYPWAQIVPDVSRADHEAGIVVRVAADVAPDRAAREPHPRSELYVHQTMDDLTRSKTGWLHREGYLARMSGWIVLWVVCGAVYFYQSRAQDSSATPRPTRRMEWWAGPALVAFGLSVTYAAFDLLMSLDPHWYSTLFGAYFFAGCAVGGIAAILLLVLLWLRRGPYSAWVSVEHRRDLGRLLFAFVFFWGYLAFSQYMLLWYVHVPETTRWFVVRGASLADGYRNSWGWLLALLLFGHFLIPFLGMMSRHVKANETAMAFWSLWMLVFHYLDLYWLVMPELGPSLTIGLIELGTTLGVLAVYGLGIWWWSRRTSLIPVGDPRLGESLRVTAAY